MYTETGKLKNKEQAVNETTESETEETATPEPETIFYKIKNKF